MERLRYQAEHGMPFRMGDKEFPPGDLIDPVIENTFLGQSVVELEVAKMGIYAELLWQEALVRRGPSREIQLPE